MKVYGYTDDKDTVDRDLPASEIVEARIDPWSVDLFDDNPIVQDGLSFRKRQDFCFAYRADGRTVVGFDDGSKQVCVYGERETLDSNHIQLDGIRNCNEAFAIHFERYLKQWQWMNFPTWQDRFSHNILSMRGLTPAVYSPQKLGDLQLHGSQLRLECYPVTLKPLRSLNNLPVFAFSFTGEMYKERQVKVVLPPQIEWLFDKLGACKPVAICEGIREALAGKKPKLVEFLFDNEQLLAEAAWNLIPPLRPSRFLYTRDSVKRDEYGLPCTVSGLRIYTVSAPAIDFVINGCRYVATTKGKFASIPQLLAADSNACSAHCLYSDRLGEVRGTRIALFDAGKNQARELDAVVPDTRLQLHPVYPAMGRAQLLEGKGVKLIERHWRTGRSSDLIIT